ncbi:hypothetical protein X734_30025 [Mesorhizobium sp. L2C084A000]|nr:hypothetical protein X734_30025 [Mesorhizobium sp. L2C084A000]
MAIKRLAACVDRDPTGDPWLQLVFDEGKEFRCPTRPDFGRALVKGRIGLARRRAEVP